MTGGLLVGGNSPYFATQGREPPPRSESIGIAYAAAKPII